MTATGSGGRVWRWMPRGLAGVLRGAGRGAPVSVLGRSGRVWCRLPRRLSDVLRGARQGAPLAAGGWGGRGSRWTLGPPAGVDLAMAVRTRWARLAVALGIGLLGGLSTGWVHLRLGASGGGDSGGLFVAGLPWPFPVAVDASAALGAEPGRLAWLPVLVALRCLWLLMLARLAAPAGMGVRPWPAGGAVILPALGAVPVELAGLVGGPLAAAAALAALVAAWSWLAAAARWRRPGWRPVVAGLAAQAAAVLLTPVGPAGLLPALTDAALGGIEGTLLVLLVLNAHGASRPARAAPGTSSGPAQRGP